MVVEVNAENVLLGIDKNMRLCLYIYSDHIYIFKLDSIHHGISDYFQLKVKQMVYLQATTAGWQKKDFLFTATI